jgi:DNA-binding NtrC family response regulator
MPDKRGWRYVTQPNPPPMVAIFNSMDELLDVVRLAFEAQGFVTATARLADIQSGALDLIAFVKEHKPVALVYDIPRPYEADCNVLRLLRETDALQHLVWVITTTNKQALERAVPKTNAIEIVLGEPYTVDEVIDAVRKGLRADGHAPVHSASFTRYRMPLDGSDGPCLE